MIYTKWRPASQGYVRTLLVIWTVILVAAALFWLSRRGTKEPTPPGPALASYHLLIDPNRTDRIGVRLDLTVPDGTGARKPTLVAPNRWTALEVRDAKGEPLAFQVSGAEMTLDAAPAGSTVRIHYSVPLGERVGSTLSSIGTRSGGAIRLRDLLLVPRDPVPLRIAADLPTGWRLHASDGMAPGGVLARAGLERGAVAWTHSARQSLVSRPNSVDVYFLGRSGAGDPVLESLGAMVRAIIREAVTGSPLEHRIILVDLDAPQHRLVIPPQRRWQILDRGPMNVHRMRRIARGVLRVLLPESSATPAGPDAIWYPRSLVYYGSYRMAEEGGARPPVDWINLWQMQEREYLWERNQRNGPRSAALKAAVVLHDIARTHVNATSIRLLSTPARSASRLGSLTTALAMQLNMTDATPITRARGAAVYLDPESPWQLPAQYEAPRPPAGAVPRPTLRLIVSAETYAEVMGCTGCPAPGTLAQRVFREQQRANEGVPTLVVDAGDWVPFFLTETPEPDAFAERLNIARLAAERAGVVARVLGPGETGWGEEVLKRLIAAGDTIPVVSANVRVKPGGEAPSAYVLKRVAGMTVAVIGLTDFPRRRYRLTWFEEVLKNIEVAEPVDAAVRAAREARAAGADLVMVVGAIDPVHARLIAVGSPEVDLIVSSAPGFDRPPRDGASKFTAHDRSGFHGRVPVLYTAGCRGGLHRFDLEVSRVGGRAQVQDFVDAAEKLTKGDSPDPLVQEREVAFNSRFGKGAEERE
jgi:hypothetical protein